MSEFCLIYIYLTVGLLVAKEMKRENFSHMDKGSSKVLAITAWPICAFLVLIVFFLSGDET